MRVVPCKREGLPHERSSAAGDVAIIPRCGVTLGPDLPRTPWVAILIAAAESVREGCPCDAAGGIAWSEGLRAVGVVGLTLG